MSSRTYFDLSVLFIVLMVIYNINLRLMSSGDCIPARLLPFSILLEGNLDLDEFDFTVKEYTPLFFLSLQDRRWQKIPGGQGSSPAVVRDGEKVRLFIQGLDGAVWENGWDTKRWDGWQKVGGHALSRPAATVDPAGRIWLFVRGDGDRIWANVRDEKGWQGWQEVPGGGRTLSAPAALVGREGHLRLFILGLDNFVWENWLEAGEWRGWRQVPDGKSLSGPAVALGPDGNSWLFVRGLDNVVWYTVEQAGRWSSWTRLAGLEVTSGPAALMDAQGRWILLVRGPDHLVWWNTLGEKEWGGWQQLPGRQSLATSEPAGLGDIGEDTVVFVQGDARVQVPGLFTYSVRGESWEEVPGGEIAASRPAVIRDADGRVHLLVHGRDNALWENIKGLHGWQGWQRISSPGGTHFEPSAVFDHDGRLRLFMRGVDNSLYQGRLKETGGIDWQPIEGGLTFSAPKAIVDQQGQIRLFIRGVDDRVHENFEHEGKWQGWVKLPGHGFAASSPEAVLDSQGNLMLLIQGRDNSIYTSTKRKERWQEWQVLSGRQTFSPPTIAVDGGGALWVFAQGMDYRIYQQVLGNGPQQASWQALPGDVSVVSGLAALPDESGDVQIFGHGLPLPLYLYFATRTRGHLISSYPVALPLTIAPLYILPAWLVTSHDLSYTSQEFALLSLLMEKLSASLLATLSALVLYMTLRDLCSRRQAIGLTLIYALATNTWTISSQALWQHGLSELALSLLVFALLKAPQSRRYLILAGLAAALAAANRPPNFLFAFLALFYVWHYHRNEIGKFLAFPLLMGSLLLAYNSYYFGAPYYFGSVYVGYRGGFFTPLRTGLLGVLVSPSRGLFIYTPVTLFSLWGMGLLWRRPLSLQTSPATSLLRYMSIGVCGQILLYAKWIAWWGGYCFGPRLLTDILPLLFLFLVPVLGKISRSRSLRIAFCVVVAFSVAIQIVGAFFYDGQWDTDLDLHPELFWDWHDTQILRSLQAGPASTLYPQIVEALKKVL